MLYTRGLDLVLGAGLGLSVRAGGGGAGAGTGPLLADQRRAQGHAVQLLSVEEEEELHRVHTQLEERTDKRLHLHALQYSNNVQYSE